MPIIRTGFIAASLLAATTTIHGGELVTWGDDDMGQHDPPTGDTYESVSCGYWFSVALKSDGTVDFWGLDQADLSVVPDETFTQISAGYTFVMGVRSDTTLDGWGYNAAGQIDHPAGVGWVAVASGDSHALGLKDDGTVSAWGQNVYGPCDVPEYDDFTAIAACKYFSLGLRSDGSIVGWGYDSVGQASPPEGNDHIAIAAGEVHGLALKSDGTLVAWGSNAHGQCDIPEGDNFVSITCGRKFSMAIDSTSRLWTWGDDGQGQVSDTPTGTGYTAIAGGGHHATAIGPVDCNENGVSDATDITDGTSEDTNPEDGIPDECQGPTNGGCCTPMGDCVVTTEEHCLDREGTWYEETVDCDAIGCEPICPGDTDGSGGVDVYDLLEVISAWGGCP